jgi:hypothetical protein
LHEILQRVLIAIADTIPEALESEGFQVHDNETVVVEYLKSKEISERQKTVAKRQMEKKVREDDPLYHHHHRINVEYLCSKSPTDNNH